MGATDIREINPFYVRRMNPLGGGEGWGWRSGGA